ncbi:hypothetical protein Tsubulata_002814 [Turnera subulata]|uniref:VOC domain-containing protein n=1 Tax=Turnera subulata TaxID=218843 RepID=A0A9Q0F0P4_9ROSI|nr:hypothetical protein Tsubulata_002814 [Turnera subulata]
MMEPLTAHRISVFLRVPSVDKAVDFYKRAFGAVECPVPSSPEKEVNRIQATKLDILPYYPFLITDSPLVPEITPGALNLCLQVKLADLEAAVSRAVNAGATTDGEVALDPTGGRPSTRLADPFGVVWFLYVPTDDEISFDHRRRRLFLDRLDREYGEDDDEEDMMTTDGEEEEEDMMMTTNLGDPYSGYRSSKLKILLKVPDPAAAVRFYTTAFGAEAPQFPTEDEIPCLDFTALELARKYYILISGSAPPPPQNMNNMEELVERLNLSRSSSGCNITLCARTGFVEELVERLQRAGAVLEGDIVWDDPIFKIRGMAKLRDPFGVLWFIHQRTLEETFVEDIAYLEETVKDPGPGELKEAFRLRQMAAREGRMWPAVAPQFPGLLLRIPK